MKVQLPNDFCSSSVIHVVILTTLRSIIRYTNADWTSYESDDCRCTEFIDDYGFGNCTRADTWFGFKFSCYVNENSTCNDTLISRFDPDKKVSAKACIKHLEKFRNATVPSSTLIYENGRMKNENMTFVIPIICFISGFGFFMYIISLI